MKTHIPYITFLTFLFFFTMKTNGQIKTYDNEWKIVENYINNGLPSSALKEVKKIHQQAKSDNQDAQIIKSLIYASKLQQQNREDNPELSIKEIEQEVTTSKEPVTSILNSYLAGLYQQYFELNRYKLYNRTNTTTFDKENIATWTISDFQHKISTLYLASLKNEELLQQTKLKSYDALITKGNMRHLRPTLYDLLAHHALDYFKSDERDITRPAAYFEINQYEAFAPAKEFAQAVFSTTDSSSLQYIALLIYQKLIRFHLNDAQPDALIDVDLERLEYARQKATISSNNTDILYIIDGKPSQSMTIYPSEIKSIKILEASYATALYGAMGVNGAVIITTKHDKRPSSKSITPLQIENKDILYYNALKHIATIYKHIPAATQARFLMAQWHEHNGNKYNANEDTTHRYELVKAKAIIDTILEQKEKSEGWTNAFNLSKRLTTPYFSFNIEKVNVPELPFRMLVTYKNVNKIFLRIVPATEALKTAIANLYNNNYYWQQITKAQPIRSWEQALPQNTDLQNHSAEIKVDPLPIGEYFIVASINNDFSNKNNILAARLTYISNISVIVSNEGGYILHRNTGQPLSNAHIQLWKKTYNYASSSYKKEKAEQYIADKNGHFSWASSTNKNSKSAYNSILDISYKNDRLNMDEENNGYYYNSFNTYNDTKQTLSIFLFTDRSLYRPGQTVYFKGIAISNQNDGKNAVIKNGHKDTVSLYDANSQKISDVAIVTNEYGSFHGKFTLPTGTLNGSFSIRTKKTSGSTYFRVEEYKRPKFYVDFEKIKGTYKVNEDVKVTGYAKAYAGNNIDGAMVKYRVVREARFPYPWLFWRGYWPQSASVEIIHGETHSDANGRFEITFHAKPDLQLDIKTDPIFDYKIYADVTDMNGETRSANQTVSVGYKSLLLKVNLATRISSDSLRNIRIRTENMSGEFEQAPINLVITKLKPEARLLRTRYWQNPDQFVMSKEEYINYFPNDIYSNENEPQTWERSSMVLHQTGMSDSTEAFALNNTTLEPGYYVIEITTKDKDNNEIKDIKYIEVFSLKQKSPLHPSYLVASVPHPIQPGEKTNIEIGSSLNNVFLIQSIQKQTIQYSYHKLGSGNKNFEFSASEEDRGGYEVNFLFVKHNRVFQSNHIIQVPWSNKELNIEYNTFRDKTLPGSEEKWSVKISGYKKEKVVAEILASMYDASLDQFYPHQWQKPFIWSTYQRNVRWNGYPNFGKSTALTKHNIHTEVENFEKNYDKFAFPTSIVFEASDIITIRGYSTQKKELTNTASPISDNDAAMEKHDAEVIEAPTSPSTFVRTNFNETAFFFPDLTTDKEGNINFTFTLPEALTRWKFQLLAHTKDLAIGYSSKEIVTQKDVMVQPNPPRFLREGDKMNFSTKVVNLSNKEITGIAKLQLFDASSQESIDGWFKNAIPQQYFTLAPGQSQAIQFPIEVPYHFNKAIIWRISATTDSVNTQGQNLSDGEENILPVLTNRILVTETLPLNMRGNGTRNFKWDKLINSVNSETLSTQSLTIEYSANPTWYAVQALPYMMEYPYDCAEQTWNKYYANTISTFIANSTPKIKEVLKQWQQEDTSMHLSNLQKNEELKSILLEETPWVLAAKNETQQKKNIALLFDLMRMSSEQNKAYEKLKQLQSPNGGFVWFKGGPDDRFITQYIVTGIGHLKKLNVVSGLQEAHLNRITQAALPYLDAKIKEEYDNLLKHKINLNQYIPSYYIIQYLYMRSFFTQNQVTPSSQKAVDFFIEKVKTTWTKQNKYMQAMIALALYRRNDTSTPKAILQSLKETAIYNEELGMYYNTPTRSWWWYEAPIETHALIIEAFEEVGKDSNTADHLRTWLLKNKQTNNWESTKATAEAIYALLLRGTNWLSDTPKVKIDIGGMTITSTSDKMDTSTGYFKKIIEGDNIHPNMGNIAVSIQQSENTNTLPTWGSMYWQYLEDMDKITNAATPLQLSKKLFVESNTNIGPVLKPINEGDQIKVGDKIKVRIELRVDREMEYVHMKDMRASSLEPVNVLSQYKWQGGLGYYETTKDASTNFFFNRLPKGTYVFEYSLFASQAGNFSNGITSIQCMYAPEFSAHSEGVRITIQ